VHENSEPTRRRAFRSEFSEDEWKLVSELADHPNRLLVTATPEGGETYAEVAHEAIFRRWDKLREWIAAEREFLAWRSGLEVARRAWQATPDKSKPDALLMGLALAQAQSWLAKRRLPEIPRADQEFILLSRRAALRRRQRVQAIVSALALGVIVTLVGWLNESYLRERWNWYTVVRPYIITQVRPYVLTAERERTLTPRDSFRECAKECPEMVVIPAGEFTMGSPATEKDRSDEEGPQHDVTIATPFAVSKFDVTFADWDACVAGGGCPQIDDRGKGRGTRPVINVNWQQAQQYVAWFSQMTGKPYRLLTEAEWEYAARADTMTPYYWGDEIGTGNANCKGCGSQWDGKEPAPVGSFPPNDFGLYDMAGNVYQWVEDCDHDNYVGAPTDGSAWISGECSSRIVRGGSWWMPPRELRSANRPWESPGLGLDGVGFRIARSLLPSSP
jgi:formylglycine-generating enzyme required for sulfatase activity